MRIHIISAAAAGLLWACPSSAFQMARPVIPRAAAMRKVNIAPLMDSKGLLEEPTTEPNGVPADEDMDFYSSLLDQANTPLGDRSTIADETDESVEGEFASFEDVEVLTETSEMDVEQAELLYELLDGFQAPDDKTEPTFAFGAVKSGAATTKAEDKAEIMQKFVSMKPKEPLRLQRVVDEGGLLAILIFPLAAIEASSQASVACLVQFWKANTPPLARLLLRLAIKDLRSGQLSRDWAQLIFDFAFYPVVLGAYSEGKSGGNGSGIIKFLKEKLPDALYRNATYDYGTYGGHDEYPDFNTTKLMKKVEGVPHVEYWFSFKKFARVIACALKTQAGIAVNPLTINDIATKENYERIFKAKGPLGMEVDNPFLKLPEHAFNHWKEDQEFARQFLNGVNPVMIEVVKDSKMLTPELRNFFEKEGIVNLEALAKANKLFYVDYVGLDDLEKNPHQAYPEVYNNAITTQDQEILSRVGKEPRYFKAPMILFRQTQNLKNIEVMAIQLDRDADSKVYTVGNSNEAEWLFAKTTVAAADSQYHEWVSHLGKTHLTMEPHIIAIHNTLRRYNHKIYPFVRPMCRDTLFLNFAARDTLAAFAPNSLGDYMTSVGTGQFMLLIYKYWKDYDFFKSSAFDEELEGRGFTDDVKLDNYRYRNDGKELWEAYGFFATQYVDECYQNDTEVRGDAVLQLWAHETTAEDRAFIPGFPKRFESKPQLARTLQTLFWICSGFHAAVNFPQYDYYAYQGNKPLGMRKSFEQWKSAKGSERWMFEEAMPNLESAQKAATTVQLLTLPSKNTIMDLDNNFSVRGKSAYGTFKKNMNRIASKIELRTKEDERTGEPKYEYLKPENIPASIDI